MGVLAMTRATVAQATTRATGAPATSGCAGHDTGDGCAGHLRIAIRRIVDGRARAESLQQEQNAVLSKH